MTTTETLLNALKANIDSIQTTLSVAEKERFVEHLQKIHDAGSYDKAEQSVNDFVDFCLKIPLLGEILEKADAKGADVGSEKGAPPVDFEPDEEDKPARHRNNVLVRASDLIEKIEKPKLSYKNGIILMEEKSREDRDHPEKPGTKEKE